MNKNKRHEEEYEFEKREIKTEAEDVKTPSCPVSAMKGRKVKCLKKQCLWWDVERNVCRVTERSNL